MKQSDHNRAGQEADENLLVTAQKKLLKPRIQNKLIFAFVSITVISIAVSTWLVIRITSEMIENEIESKLREANSTVLSVVERYEEQASETLEKALENPGFVESLKKEKVSSVFTPPISVGSEAVIALWLPSGHPLPGTGPTLPQKQPLESITQTKMVTEINGMQTLLAGAVATIADDERQYGTLAVGFDLGKSFAQDLEIMTGADIRVFFEKIPARPRQIFFEGNSSDLPEAALDEIEKIARYMREHPEFELLVEGHTDATGSERQNYRVGLRRAEAVKDALVEKGIASYRIQTISFGETRAIAPEKGQEGEALNRRVELEFTSRERRLVGSIEDLPMPPQLKRNIFDNKRRSYERDALLKGEPYRAIYQPLVGAGGKVLGLIFVGMPRKYTFESTVTASHFYPIILLVGFLMATILGYTISRSISRPIRRLYRGVLTVADGDLDQTFKAEAKDEIGDLGRAFNIMTRKLRQLRELEQEMQRRSRLAALGELSAGVAHEIRNPLGVIKNSAEMLRERIKDESKRRELTGYIIEEVERLNKVVSNFLQFARPAEPKLDRVDINEALEHTLSFLAIQTESTNINVEKVFGDNLPPVFADPEQFHQVFLNLCMNAFQAMNGEGNLRVETRFVGIEKEEKSVQNAFSPGDAAAESLEANTPIVETVITDNGAGIPPETLSRIFDPFFSTKDEGVGLGLSLVHKIIENHNGRIRVSSSPDSGTTFTVSLPAMRTPESEV